MKRIETAALKALGASARALKVYLDTDPCTITEENGTYTIDFAGDVRTFDSADDLLQYLDEAAEAYGVPVKTYKVFSGIREIKSSDLLQMDEESIFDLFLSGDYANSLILETDSHAEALELLNKKRPTMRVGNETMYGKRPVECCWIEEYDEEDYAGTLEHSAWESNKNS
jgi:hypothetical protein